LNSRRAATAFTLRAMMNNTENDQQPQAADPQPTAPVEKMLDALDELMAAARRVAVETSTSADRLPDNPEPSEEPKPSDELSIGSR
jgi:hypothetical protein